MFSTEKTLLLKKHASIALAPCHYREISKQTDICTNGKLYITLTWITVELHGWKINVL